MLLPEESTVIAGTGPLVYLFVNQMLAAGHKPALILDTAANLVPVKNWGHLLRAFATDAQVLFKGQSWLHNIKKAGIRRITGVTAIRARGEHRIQSIEYVRGNRRFETDCSLLLVHDGVIPNNHLAVAAGCKQIWNPLQRYWSPALDANGLSSQSRISIAGDSAGILGAEAAACAGNIVGWHVASSLGLIDREKCAQETLKHRQTIKKISVLRRFLDNHYQPLACFQTPENAETVVCRCENVSVDEIRRVAKLGCMGPNQAKAFTRCGMGPCMGRQCGNTVSQLFAKLHGRNVSDIGHYRIRPPVRPLTLRQMANLDFPEA